MFKVIGFNKDGSQTLLEVAPTLYVLLKRYAQDVIRHESTGDNNILPTFIKIKVAEDNAFIDLDLPYIPTVAE